MQFIEYEYDETRTDFSSSFEGGWCDGHLANDWEEDHWRRLARKVEEEGDLKETRGRESGSWTRDFVYV